jgi:hypothetical protein
MARSPLALLLVLGCAAGGAGDEGVRTDGRRVGGQLTFSPTGRFTFTAADKDLSISELDRVRFAVKAKPLPGVPLWHQVRLVHGDVFLAEVRKLDATHLHVRTAWAESLAIPRVAIERVAFPLGQRVDFFDSFESDLGAWKTTGEPRTAEGRLLLDRSGQAAEGELKKPLVAGQVGVGFRGERTRTRIAALQLGFVRDRKPAAVRVELVGPGENFSITSPTQAKLAPPLKRDAKSHRLSIEFDRDRLNVFLDEFVAWTQDEGPGELRSLKLVTEGEGTEASAMDDVLVAHAEPAGPLKSWADLTSDAVRSPEGDETFGTLVSAGPSGVTLEVKDRKRSLRWPDAAELTFHRGPLTESATTGEHVQLRVRSGEAHHDILTGAVKLFDAKAIVLVHPLLGQLSIPRDRVEEVRVQFHGRRVPIDSSPHHLGAKPAFGFAVPKPEGLSLKKSVRLDAPTAGFLVVEAAHLSGMGTPLEVLVNGESLGELNKQADRADATVRSYRLPLPAARELEIELRLKRPRSGGRAQGADVRAIRLELHEPR